MPKVNRNSTTIGDNTTGKSFIQVEKKLQQNCSQNGSPFTNSQTHNTMNFDDIIKINIFFSPPFHYI